jgi:hypothetical protein
MIPGLLSEGMLRAVRDPVDRIWAVAGLFEGSFRHQIMQHIGLGPKAHQEYWSTYINFTKELLLWVPSLGILPIPPSPERDPRLPKWCPDFSKWPTHDGMYTFSTTSVQVSPDWEIQTILPGAFLYQGVAIYFAFGDSDWISCLKLWTASGLSG